MTSSQISQLQFSSNRVQTRNFHKYHGRRYCNLPSIIHNLFCLNFVYLHTNVEKRKFELFQSIED